MSQAIALAWSVKGKTFPNPAVGALVVRKLNIVGSGTTQAWGGPHAERVALRKPVRSPAAPHSMSPWNHVAITVEPLPASMRLLKPGYGALWLPSATKILLSTAGGSRAYVRRESGWIPFCSARRQKLSTRIFSGPLPGAGRGSPSSLPARSTAALPMRRAHRSG